MATHKMYSKLVNDKDDITGLIAYALYKQQKIEFFQNVRKENGGQEPTEEAIKAFIQSSSTEYQIKSYRERAENMLNEIVVSVTGEQIKQASDEMLKDYENRITTAVKKANPWWISLVLNIVGALLFSGLVTLVLFLGNYSERTAKNAVDEYIRSTVDSTEKSPIALPSDTIKPQSPN